MKLGFINGVFPRLLRSLIYKISGSPIRLGQNVRIHPYACISADGGSITLGDHCRIHRGAIIATYGGHIVIGNNVSINPYTIVYGHGGLKIGDGSRIAAHVVMIPSEHNFHSRDKSIGTQGSTHKGIVIGKDVWIASGAKILDGSIIGDGCIIGANAVVKGVLEPYGVYVGMPAKRVKERL